MLKRLGYATTDVPEGEAQGEDQGEAPATEERPEEE